MTETHTETEVKVYMETIDTVEDTTVSLPQYKSTVTTTTKEDIKTTLVIVLSIVCTICAFGAFYSLFKCQQDGDDEVTGRTGAG